MNFSVFLLISELLGTVAFSVSGVLVAKKQKLDLFGAIVLGVTTAVGGGALRDILLGNTPPVMFRHPVYALTALITAVVIFLVEKHSRLLEESDKVARVLNAADTIGLGVFAVSGTNMAILSAHKGNMFLAVFVGTMTAVGGGILRDMLAGTIPVVMRKRIYAVAAILGAVLYYILRAVLKLPEPVSEVLSILVVAGLRVLAIHFMWNLPSFSDQGGRE